MRKYGRLKELLMRVYRGIRSCLKGGILAKDVRKEYCDVARTGERIEERI